MKKYIIIFVLIAVLMPAGIKAQEPDTIWTTRVARQRMWFTPDGTRLIDYYGRCLDVSDGHLIWENEEIYPYGIFTKDSLYFYADEPGYIGKEFAKFRISDGTLYETGFYPKLSEYPPILGDTADGWEKPEIGNIMMGEDENTFYFLCEQKYLHPTTREVNFMINLIFKYKRDIDSVVSYKPILINGDTILDYNPQIFLLQYSKATNAIVTAYWKKDWIEMKPAYRQISISTLDSASEFIFNEKKWGGVKARELSYTGKYYAIGTSDGESDLGWIIIYDLTTNSIYNRFLEREPGKNASAEHIAFSRNDSFVVTNGGRPARTKTWNFHTGTLIHTYEMEGRAVNSLDVSPDNTKIIVPSLIYTALLRARWTAPTAVEDNGDDKALYLYPNPATGEVNVPIGNRTLKGTVRVYDVSGNVVLTHPLTPSREGESVRLDVSSLSAGTYMLVLDNGVSYKLIVNK
jgi:hypothetical protein